MTLEPLELALGVVTETDQRLSALIGGEKRGGVHGDLLSVEVVERSEALGYAGKCFWELIDIEIGVAEEELVAGGWWVFFVVFAEGREMDALLGKAGGKVGVTALGVEFENEVEAAVLLDDRRVAGEGAGLDGVENELALAGVEEAHAVDVLFKIAFAEKAGEGELFEVGNGAGIKTELLVKAVGEGWRQHHVADAHSGGKGFGKGVHINDAGGSVKALQRGNRTTMEAKFAVVVVFDDGTAGLFAGPGEEFVASADGHGDAGGKLVGGADVGDLGLSGAEAA